MTHVMGRGANIGSNGAGTAIVPLRRGPPDSTCKGLTMLAAVERTTDWRAERYPPVRSQQKRALDRLDTICCTVRIRYVQSMLAISWALRAEATSIRSQSSDCDARERGRGLGAPER